MKEFFLSLFRSDGEVSSKRVIAFMAMILFIGEAVVNMFGVPIDKEIVYTTVGILLSSLGLTMWNNQSANKS